MNSFTGRILTEDPLPTYLTDEHRHLLNRHTSARLIWGEGNSAAPVFIVLDNPGARETKEGEPFLCGTRETLQKGISAAGLELEQIYVSFLLKARPLKKYDKEKARRLSLNFLLEQIKKHEPTVVVCLGDVGAKAYFADPQVSAKSLRAQRHILHGFTTVVSYHPLAVRRRPSLYRYFVEDLSLAAQTLAMKNDYSKFSTTSGLLVIILSTLAVIILWTSAGLSTVQVLTSMPFCCAPATISGIIPK